MNGLNKQKKVFKKQTIIVVIVYLLLSIMFIVGINNLMPINNFILKKEVINVKKDIEDSLNDDRINNSSLDKITQSMPMQIVIKQGDNIMYSNTAINDVDLLRASVSDEVVYYDSIYNIEKNNHNYQIYLLVYNKPTADIINLVSIIFIVALLLISLVIVALIISAGRLLIKPLDYLGSNLQKLKSYKFDGIMSLEDKVELFSEELKDFAQDIKAKSEDFGVAYTSLEKELLMSKEKSDYKKQLVSSLVHDLKTPINIIKLQATSLEKETRINESLIKQNDALVDININADNILVDVKEILNVVNLEKIDSLTEEIDLSIEIKKSIRLFVKLFRERDLHTNISLLPTAIVYVNKVEIQSVINNALANIYKYAKQGSDVDIVLDTLEDMYVFEVTNESDGLEKIDFDNAFNLFQVNDENSDGTGVGLFVVNQFVQKNSGHCNFKRIEDRVVLQIKLPIVKG